MNLRIEEPCHENWNAMTQQEKGRHCDKCCKTVFDFTKMPTEEVIQFISSRKKDSVCGRFTAEQVQVPAAAKNQLKISWTFKKFLAAVLLVFGGALFTGCGNETMGEYVVEDSITEKMGLMVVLPDTTLPKDTAKAKDSVPGKSNTEKNTLKGKVSCDPIPKQEVYYNGGVSIIPEPPTVVGLTVVDVPGEDTVK
jgi:hypothetical protein